MTFVPIDLDYRHGMGGNWVVSRDFSLAERAEPILKHSDANLKIWGGASPDLRGGHIS